MTPWDETDGPGSCGRTLHRGTATGRLLRLDLPLSFWGGVDAAGTIVDRHHPQVGASLTGRVLAMTSGRGSSSSSSVLAELVRSGAGPAAVLLTVPDAVVALGAIVAGELYGLLVPVVQVDAARLAVLPDGEPLHVEAGPARAILRPG